MTPYPDQFDLISRARAAYAAGARRVLVQAPVGYGKTVVTSEIVRAAVAKGKRVLFLAHRRRLIDQKSRKLDQFGVRHGVLMAGVPPRPWLPVQVCSRDTLLSRAVRNDWLARPPADLVIVDEAHRVMSDEYRALLSAYPDAHHLGVTATPAREDGRGLGGFYQALECAPPISWLVARGRLCPVKCFAPQNPGGAKSRRRLAGDPVATWLRLGAGRPTVLFAGKVEHSRAACAAFLAAGVTAEHIDADTPDDERDAVIARVESGATQVLCNCSVLTEGVDVPCLSCIVLLRLASSYVLFIQAVGRVMRAHPGKADAVLIDHADAVLEHGFPDEDAEWSLDEGDTVERRNRDAKKEGQRSQPVVCPKCGLCYPAAPACPACGGRLPRKMQPAAVRNQLLTEVERGLTPERQREWRVRFWHGCLACMAHKGGTLGAASQMYRRRYGEWPPADFPNPSSAYQAKRRVADVYPQYLERRTA